MRDRVPGYYFKSDIFRKKSGSKQRRTRMEKHHTLMEPYETLNRRSFLKLSGLLGLGVTSVGILPVGAETIRFNKKTFKVSETRSAMGTYVSMTLFDPSRDKAQEAMGRAFEEIERL
ncbi:MAG: hypothetical protein DRH37_03880, partial [Deltaproteobacteria bacterium]